MGLLNFNLFLIRFSKLGNNILLQQLFQNPLVKVKREELSELINDKKESMKLKTILFTSLVTLSSFTTINDTESVSLTHELLYEQIIEKNIKYPEVVFAQAVLESGHFKAPLFISQNNLFGMKVPKKRETTAINKGNKGYAKYLNWSSSIDDYLLWQQFTLKNKSGLTKSQYLSLLGKIYAKDKNYVSTLKRVMGKHKKILE
jgi:uncharacterized FlgJ-related protein